LASETPPPATIKLEAAAPAPRPPSVPLKNAPRQSSMTEEQEREYERQMTERRQANPPKNSTDDKDEFSNLFLRYGYLTNTCCHYILVHKRDSRSP
jgi:hypothetical protein